MKNVIILLIILAAAAGVVALKKSRSCSSSGSLCPCKLLKTEQTNQIFQAEAAVE